MKRKLTIKQEKFCLKYHECGNASEAYRHAYDCSKKTEGWVYVEATKMLDNPKITLRVKELQEEAKRKSDITKEEILGLCVDTIRGKIIPDRVEDRDGKKVIVSVSKTWAIERVCKMLGFDAPVQNEIKGSVSVGQDMTEEEKKAEIRRICKSINRCDEQEHGE